jgi:hypothetical protein
MRPPARRLLFGFSSKPPREAKDTNLDPGLRQMVDLMLMEKVQARPPPLANLVKGFNMFAAYKLKAGEAVNRIQADHVIRTFRHLRDNPVEDEGGLTLKDLENARDAMSEMPVDKTDLHNTFAREVFGEIQRRRSMGTPDQEESNLLDVKQLVKVLTMTGDSTQARDHAAELSASLREDQPKHRRRMSYKLWRLVLQGFAFEGNQVELLRTAKMAEDSGVPYTSAFHETMTSFFASRNELEQTKEWYERKLYQDRPSAITMSEVLQFSLRNNELEWCNSVFKTLLESNPDKPTWDVIFQWAAGGLGKGVEEVEHMINVMVRHNKENEFIRPDVDTINGLVELAMSKKDPYLAERYLALGSKLGIRPNSKTYILQMNYRIDAGDLAGAQAVYVLLQGEEIVKGQDVPVINRYITALCSVPSPNYDRITGITSDLEERNARLGADTVSALCLLHLERDEIQDVLDILNSHVFHHTLDERSRVRNSLLDYCLDRNNTTLRVWDAYTIIRQIFDETDTSTRTRLMNEFFERKRCDMACHVFGHMRQHIRSEKRPVADTYVQCLEGIAKCEDMEHLDMVHNMMKMDSSIEPSTKLYNALMLAYTACEEPYRALDFWDDITNSREGPTYNSIQIVFRACETKPFGDKPANEIWNKMRRMEIDVTPEVYSAYVGALAGQGLIDKVKDLIEGMQADVGFEPDMMT